MADPKNARIKSCVGVPNGSEIESIRKRKKYIEKMIDGYKYMLDHKPS